MQNIIPLRLGAAIKEYTKECHPCDRNPELSLL